MIWIVAGVRPQYIKAAALLNFLKEERKELWEQSILIDTRQHWSRGMLSQRRATRLNSAQYFNLSQAWSKRQSLVDRAARALLQLDKAVSRGKLAMPSRIIVFGDALPAWIGASFGALHGVPVDHFDAGAVRDPGDPEEAIRRAVDSVAAQTFCVTLAAARFLEAEQVSNRIVHFVGDLTWNALGDEVFAPASDVGVLVTIHRASNRNPEALAQIAQGLVLSGRSATWVTHPATHRYVKAALKGASNVNLMEPISWNSMLSLIAGSDFLLSDSGGLIREANMLGRHSIVRRDEGGWNELVDSGVNLRAGSSAQEIANSIAQMGELVDIEFESIFVPPPESRDILRDWASVAIAGLKRSA
jgi:UDP-N-acetylglucosamine 2-epimerase